MKSRRLAESTFKLLVAVLAVAAVIRGIGLDAQELWFDECTSVLFCADPQGILHALRNDTNAPLYFLLLKSWIALFGIEPISLRSLSLVFGVLQLAVTAAWALELGLSRRVAIWAAFIGSMLPFHIHYSQEARGYPLTWLLISLALWAFTRAMRRDSRPAMAAHGIALLAALYAHNLAIWFVPALWIAALIIRPRRRTWLAFMLTHIVVGMLYVPWFLHLWNQARTGGGTGWILHFWREASWFTLIPESLLKLSCGGCIPTRLQQPVLPDAARIVTQIWTTTLAGGFAGMFWSKPFARRTDSRRMLSVLVVLLLAPLLFTLLYSLLVRPIYVVGRYDTLVYPPLLCMLAIGTDAVCRALGRFSQPVVVIVAAAVLWAVPGFYMTRLHLAAGGNTIRKQETRCQILAQMARPDDLIVCLDLEGLFFAYDLLKRPLTTPWITFPASTGTHPGWLEFPTPTQNQMEADTVLAHMSRERASRVWLLFDPQLMRPDPTLSGDSYSYTEQAFRQSLADHHLAPDDSIELSRAGLQAIGLEVYARAQR